MAKSLPIRSPDFSPPEGSPRVWSPDNLAFGMLCNAFGCAGPFERMSIMICRDVLPSITDPALREAIRGFVGQEQQHMRAHNQEASRLSHEHPGWGETKRLYEQVLFKVLYPRLNEPMKLAWLAGFEHVTLQVATLALRSRWMKRARSPVADLYRWHAAEEVEHRTIANEMLRARGVGYLYRIAGLGLIGVSFIPTLFFSAIRQSYRYGLLFSPRTLWESLILTFERYGLLHLSAVAIFSYLNPRYDPADCELEELAQQVLRQYPAKESPAGRPAAGAPEGSPSLA